MSWAEAGPEVAEPQVISLCLEAQECMIVGRWLDLASQCLLQLIWYFLKLQIKIFSASSLEIAKLLSTKVAQQPNEKPAIRIKYIILNEWNLGLQDQRQLFIAISNILKEHKSLAKENYIFLTKYLAHSLVREDTHAMVEAKKEAAYTIIEFVKAPDVFQMPAVAFLEKHTKYALIYQLLKIFLTQRLNAYLDFHTANSELLKSYGLVHEYCIAKMRLMSMVDLASHESGQISYYLVKDTLQIEDDEVEQWVVKAITAKLIDCKFDQINKVIIVSRYSRRIFGPLQWQALRTKIATWRQNIGNAINTSQANKVTEEGTRSMQGLMIR